MWAVPCWLSSRPELLSENTDYLMTKKRLTLALLALLAVAAPAKVQADACLNLPDYPANQVTFQVADYYPTPQTAISYLTADIQSGPLPSGRYQAWCADGGTSFQELAGNGS